MSIQGYRKSNRDLWNEWAVVNLSSPHYNVAEFKQGREVLRDYEIQEMGNLHGKTLLHLQCHFGLDSLAWARLGAHVIGIDFSQTANGNGRQMGFLSLCCFR